MFVTEEKFKVDVSAKLEIAIIDMLAERGKMSSGELVERTGLCRQYVNKLLNRMKGIVVRKNGVYHWELIPEDELLDDEDFECRPKRRKPNTDVLMVARKPLEFHSRNNLVMVEVGRYERGKDRSIINAHEYKDEFYLRRRIPAYRLKVGDKFYEPRQNKISPPVAKLRRDGNLLAVWTRDNHAGKNPKGFRFGYRREFDVDDLVCVVETMPKTANYAHLYQESREKIRWVMAEYDSLAIREMVPARWKRMIAEDFDIPDVHFDILQSEWNPLPSMQIVREGLHKLDRSLPMMERKRWIKETFNIKATRTITQPGLLALYHPLLDGLF